MAIINGRLLSVGESIHGAKVVAISPYTVRLRKHKRNITLRLVPKVTHNKSTQQGKNK